MANIVNATFLGPKGILLARRSQHKKAYPGLWSFPGGHVEENETLEEALVRETEEELNTRPQSFEFLMQISDPVSQAVTYHIYIVSRWDREPEIANNEHTELKWLSVDEAKNLRDLALMEYLAVFEQLELFQQKRETALLSEKH
ncbi:mutator protein MutT [Ochrobactrum daejeonense]|uniref:8-oxo-dGTP diphosphatase n=1 Tax=Brucella daejeonensis TaxID=659015 RepID=A0A7W9AXS7_9HYPH|nr:NUDIX domain-containing protein [Brucella daejeonensis]MBB5702575.1 mutator protein MutT [Brucella daejeonensis]